MRYSEFEMCFSIGLMSTQHLSDWVFIILVWKFTAWVSFIIEIVFFNEGKKIEILFFLPEYAYGGHALACSGIFSIQPKDVCELGAQFQFRFSIFS